MRLFAALPVPERVRTALVAAQQDLRRTGCAASWAAPAALHLTLFFFGEAEPGAVSPLLTAAVAGWQPFTVALGGIGAFPSLSRPRVLWAGVVEGGPSLAGLAGRVRTAAVGAGFTAEDRPFTGHVTLGRLRAGARPLGVPDTVSERSFGTFTADRVDLLCSVLRPGGAEYAVVSTHTLS